MKKFFAGLLIFILIVIIVGGGGYVGYNYLKMNQSTAGMTADQERALTAGNNNGTGDTNSQADNSMGSMSMGDMTGETSSHLSTILKNKDYLDQARASLKSALEYLTLDPYAPAEPMQSEMDMDMGGGMVGMQTTEQTTTPESNTMGTNTMTGMTMQSMGAVYDEGKMQQLHSGLYKLSIGMELLEQLSNDFQDQAAFAGVSTQNPIQDYTNLYNLTTMNKNILAEAMGYIEEASTLVNINPYISSDGYVYDQERMEQIHQSLVKLAESVAVINVLDNDLSSQQIELANNVQMAVNNVNIAASNASMSTMNTTMTTEPANTTTTTGIFSNITLSGVITVVLVLFVIGLILSLLGFIFSLFKTPAALKKD